MSQNAMQQSGDPNNVGSDVGAKVGAKVGSPVKGGTRHMYAQSMADNIDTYVFDGLPTPPVQVVNGKIKAKTD